jgi:glycosyltransferase involved in cell wall biosynthesis
MKIVQINSVLSVGSTGRIVEGIGKSIQKAGYTSYIAYGRRALESTSNVLRIGSQADVYSHGFKSLACGLHGLGSTFATKSFVSQLDVIKPDIVHLHNIHGYYLNYEIFFDYLKDRHVPVVWTLHDCWAFTGHCAYFDEVGCQKWMTECNRCPQLACYPKSFFDNSTWNFRRKKKAFCQLSELHIVTPSNWLGGLVSQSFLKMLPLKVVNYGVDQQVFRRNKIVIKEPIVLGVASPWSKRKGLSDFFKLRDLLPSSYRIVLVGLDRKQLSGLPEGIEGYPPTDSIFELVEWYNRASVFINATYSDNFPVVNLEALSCGTPVVTYDTGGSAEAISIGTGLAVECGNVKGLAEAAISFLEADHESLSIQCRERAINCFNDNDRFGEYVRLYEEIAK